MKRELIFRPEAEVELVEAFDWYEQLLRGLGSEFLIQKARPFMRLSEISASSPRSTTCDAPAPLPIRSVLSC